MNYLQQVLNQFGLSDNETKIYLAALKQDETSPFALSRATKIPRTTVYDVLMSLSLKGLVTLQPSDGFTKQQTKIKANNPSVLRQIIHQKQRDLGTLDVSIVDILPELKGAYHRDQSHADFKFYPGLNGARQVYFSAIVEDATQPAIVFENMMPMDAFGREAINQDVAHGTQNRLKTHTRIRELIPLNDWTKHVITYQSGRDPHYFTVRDDRFIENPGFNLHEQISIQGNRLSIACVKDDEAWGLVINSPALAATLTSIFELLWLQATPITPEFIQSLGPNRFLEAEKTRGKSAKPPSK